MDRYKEGYNDCERKWRDKIEEIKDNLEKEIETSSGEELLIFDSKIEILEDLLKKG